MTGADVLEMLGGGMKGDQYINGELITREMVAEWAKVEFTAEEALRIRQLARVRDFSFDRAERVNLKELGFTEAEVAAAKDAVAEEVADELGL